MDLNEAKAVALDVLAHEQKACKFRLALFDVITEKPYGWLFGYESEAFVRTGNLMDAAFGTMGFLILKKTGAIFGFPSAHNPEHLFAQLEQAFSGKGEEAVVAEQGKGLFTVYLGHVNDFHKPDRPR